MNLFSSNFIPKLNDLYCNCFPIKIKHVNNKTLTNPWFTPELVKLMQANSQYWNVYKLGSREVNNRYRNKVKKVISNFKDSYCRNLFGLNQTNERKT